MSGMPSSGKSFVVSRLLEKVRLKLLVISPKTFRDDSYDKLKKEEQHDQDIAAWEVSLDLLAEKIKELGKNEIIVYDTCCATYEVMEPYFKLAKRFKHSVAYVYVKANLDVCSRRTKDKLDTEVEQKYIDKFTDGLPRFSKLCDHRVIVENNDDVDPDISKLVEIVNSVHDR
jgi:predicted kinase